MKRLYGLMLTMVLIHLCSSIVFGAENTSMSEVTYYPKFEPEYQVSLPLVVDIMDNEYSKIEVGIEGWNDVPLNMMFISVLGSNSSYNLEAGDHSVNLIYQSGDGNIIQPGDVFGSCQLDSVNGFGSKQVIAELEVKVTEKAEYAEEYQGHIFVGVMTEL